MKLTGTKTFLLLIFIQTTLLSCKETSSEPNIEKAITDLTDRFSQLPKGKSKQEDFYKLVRSVKHGEKEFELQLRSSPDSLNDPQQIIILINAQGNYYGIPFFSNAYRDYWDFQFDRPIPNVKRTNTTFEKELVKALDTLHLNDSIGTGRKVIDEMIFSLLHCTSVNEGDSTDLMTLFSDYNWDIPEESSDSGFARLKKNYKAISSDWHPSEFENKYWAFWDRANHRIYQFTDKHQGRGKRIEPSIKVYRQDHVIHLMSM